MCCGPAALSAGRTLLLGGPRSKSGWQVNHHALRRDSPLRPATLCDVTLTGCQRLTAAGGSWGSRIAADPANAQLTYRVRGRGEGSVASAITAGKHRFLVDEPAALAGDDLSARKLVGIDESVRAGFSDIRLTVTRTGPESDERYQELHEVVDKHCPVLDLFVDPTPVSIAVVKG